MSGRRLKFWGWGYEDEQPSKAQLKEAARYLSAHIGFGSADVERPFSLSELTLPKPRIAPPSSLERICSSGIYERASHAHGKSYSDVVRAFRGQIEHPPDVVAFPNDEQEASAVLHWCADVGAAAIPFGGGTSVVGGVEPRVDGSFSGTVAIDMKRLARVIEVDPVSRAARIQAGATGPLLEDQLRPHGLTLRHYPQSFEFSTLGGWIATRAGGHFATLYTHIDDLVESVRVLTPRGIVESRRLPASGAGPSPDRLFIGSEGALGIITEAWLRVQARPQFRGSAAFNFPDFLSGSHAVREIGQAGLYPSNCRLVDATEAALTGAGSGGATLLLLGFESSDHPVDAWMARATECCHAHGGLVSEGAPANNVTVKSNSAQDRKARPTAAGAWREAFFRMPYLRDVMVAMGVISETFESAITWDKLEQFYAEVIAATEAAVRKICGAGTVTCRLTHVYPDGAAPYFTVLAPGRRGEEIGQWRSIKEAAAEAVIKHGGTITHHHAVGRDHRPWYDRQRPDLYADALAAAKKALDPRGILNPGVLIG